MKPIHVVGLVRAKLRERTNAKLDAAGLDFGPETYSVAYVRAADPNVIVAYGFGPAACTRAQTAALKRVDTDDGLEGVRIIWSRDATLPTDEVDLDALARRYGLVRYAENLEDDQDPPPPPTRDTSETKLPLAEEPRTR